MAGSGRYRCWYVERGVRNVSDVDLQAVNLSTFQPFAEGCGKGLDGLKVWIAAGQAIARSGSSENTRF